MRLTSGQVLGLICQGRLGLFSQARRAGEAQWTRTAERAEFGYGFPHLNFAQAGAKVREALGIAAINSHLPSALDLAKKAAMDPKARNLGFWFSAHVDWAPIPIVRRTHMFQLWDGFWLAPIVESSTVKPGGWLNVYLAAFNLTKKEQRRFVNASGAPITEDAKRGLAFALPPWKWTVQRISVPATDAPGEHVLSFKTKTGAERAATAIAVGVLSLGTFVHVPGSSGFTLRYRILPPQVAKTVADWEAYAVQSAARRFEAANAHSIADLTGNRVPKDAVLQRFQLYLTPALILAALEDKTHRPEDTMNAFFDDFLFDAFRAAGGAEKAFVAG